MTGESNHNDLKQHLQRVETLLQSLSKVADPSLREKLTDIVSTLLQFHAAGIDRMMELISTSPAGVEMIDALGRDELVSSVLLLHGLHPLDLETRVNNALIGVRPYLASHGGNVELLEISQTDGSIRLRLEGSCHGCPSSRVTLRSTIDQAIYDAAPEVTAIHVEGAIDEEPAPMGPRDGFVPLSEVTTHRTAPAASTVS